MSHLILMLESPTWIHFEAYRRVQMTMSLFMPLITSRYSNTEYMYCKGENHNLVHLEVLNVHQHSVFVLYIQTILYCPITPMCEQCLD